MADADGLKASDAQERTNCIISDDGDPASGRASGNSFGERNNSLSLTILQ